MPKKHWIQNAIQKPDAESAAARRAGESTLEYAEEHAGDSGKAGKRARLTETLVRLNRKRAANG